MRLLGVNIPDQKRIDIALTYVYGVGSSLSKRAVADSHIDPSKRAKDITSEEINKLKTYIEKNYRIEGELRQMRKEHIQRLKELGTYRGTRHLRRLPVRGQRTKTNSRTVRGNVRKTAGSGKRKVDLK